MLTNPFTFLTLTGFSARIIQHALILCTLLFSSLAFSNDISGIWKHAKSPAWIEVRQETGIATVVRNDKFPERVGREILKTIKTANPQQSLWHGLFYVEKLGEYKRVEISFPDADRMLITAKKGLFSHTVEWFRVNNKAIH
ncbi:MAG: hypothetical protein QMC22_06285 [Pseudomonadales bacterium]